MKRKKKFIFLPVVMAAILMLGACNKSSSNNTPVDDNTQQNGGGDQNNNPVTTFTVSFGANGGTGTMADVTGISGEYTLPACSFTAPEGKHFAGWKVGGEGDLLAVGAKINVTANVQLVAQWETTTYVVSFGANGGTGTMADVSGVVGSYTLPEFAFTAPAGKVFAGWKVNGEGDLLQPGASITVSANVQLVAQYETAQYTVQFKVDGENYGEAQTVAHGGKVTKPADPTKQAGGDVYKYRFAGWDKDLDAEITANTVINAKFEAYAAEMVVDDFESYASSEAIIDNGGWKAMSWVGGDNGSWSDSGEATVSLGTRALEGNKSLRLDAFKNGNAYKIRKDFEANAFAKEANALQFGLMVPRGMNVAILFTASADVIDETTHQPKNMDVEFRYRFVSETSEYVKYTIPLNDMNWKAWDGDGKTIKVLANAIGLHEDDILKTAKRIEFSIKGTDSANSNYIAYLDSFKAVTLDEPANTQVETMGQYTTYTGTTTGGNVVKIQLGANGAATATIVDMKTPMVIPGTVAINNKEVTFTSTTEGQLTYKTRLVDGGRVLEYISATGSLAPQVANMNCNAVQVMENFDQYTEDGESYHKDASGKNPADASARSGARGAYYSEYYNESYTGDNSPFSGAKWSLMGNPGDQFKLKTDGGHSGNNYGCMKNSQYNGMRYFQWGLYDGTAEQKSFYGSKFSFWAKTNGLVKDIHVYVFSKPQATLTNFVEKSYLKYANFKETAAVGEWKHYEVDLNPELVYYGYAIFLKENYSADSYFYIDDVEVYTANPYATYVAPKEIINKSSYVAKVNNIYNASLTFADETNVSLDVPALEQNYNGTYEVNANEITMTFSGVEYVATISSDTKSFAFKSLTGTTPAELATELNNLSFKMIDYADNCESYESAGKMYYQSNKDESQATGARGAYHCDYYTGTTDANLISPIGGNGWSLMGGSGDQLDLDKTTAAVGKQSLKMKFSTAGNMRYLQWCLKDGSCDGYKGVNKFGLYIKNANAAAVPVKVYAYHIKTVTPSTQGDSSRTVKELTIPANSDWTFYSFDLDSSKAYYGYGIYMNYKGSTGFLNVDGAVFYNNCLYNNPNGLILSGELNDGVAASLAFKTNPTKIYLTCAALSQNDTECACKQYMYSGHQVMEITIGSGDNKTVIKGEYAVNSSTNLITFTVAEATGALAAQVKIGNVFSFQA